MRPTDLLFGGLATIDLFFFAEELPSIGEKATAAASSVDVGGPAANAAISAAILGSETTLHSVLGVGPMAEFARRLLASHSVAMVDHSPSHDPPLASVWVDGSGDRAIISTDNKRSEVRARSDRIDLSGAAAVLLDGHYPDLQLAIAKAAVSRGVPILLDCGRWRPVYAELLPVASDVIMTATFQPPGMASLSAQETVEAIHHEYRPSMCAMSRGPDPIILVDEAGLAHLEVPQVDAVDTTGAGDVLHGAYLHYRYSEQLEERVALRRAAAVASLSCRSQGARAIADPGRG